MFNADDLRSILATIDKAAGWAASAQDLGPFYFALMLFIAIPIIAVILSRSAVDNIRNLVGRWFNVSLVIGALCICLSVSWWFYAKYRGFDELKTNLARLEIDLEKQKNKMFAEEFKLTITSEDTVAIPINMPDFRPKIIFIPNEMDKSSYTVVVISDAPIGSEGFWVQFMVIRNGNPAPAPTPLRLNRPSDSAVPLHVRASRAESSCSPPERSCAS